MTEEPIIEKLQEILTDYADMSTFTLDCNSALSSDIGLSSLDYFAFISQVEDTFGVSLSDKELMSFRTVGDLVACIESKRS